MTEVLRPVEFVADVGARVRSWEERGLRRRVASESGAWVDLVGRRGMVAVHEVASADTASTDGEVHLSFESDDLDGLAARLAAAGSPEVAVVDEAYGRSLQVVDPAGATVQVDAVAEDDYGFTRREVDPDGATDVVAVLTVPDVAAYARFLGPFGLVGDGGRLQGEHGAVELRQGPPVGCEVRVDAPLGADLRIEVDADWELRLARPDLARQVGPVVRAELDRLRPWEDWAHGDVSDEAMAWWYASRVERWADGTAVPLLLVGRSSGRVVGSFGADLTTPGEASLGYWLAAEVEGRGLARVACERLVQHLAAEHDVHRVWLTTAVGNTRSRALAARLGMTEEAVLPDHLDVAGTLHDAVVCAREV